MKAVVTRPCTKCRRALPQREFNANRRSRDGLHPQCRDCQRRANDRRRTKPRKKAPRRLPTQSGFEVCTRCNSEKLFREFAPDKRGRNGLRAMCRECGRKDGAPRRTPEARQRWARNRIPKLYGISADEYDARFVVAGHTCQVCLTEPATHFDHDHETGSPREPLCRRCNQGLGFFRDDPALLFEAAAYLLRHRSRRASA